MNFRKMKIEFRENEIEFRFKPNFYLLNIGKWSWISHQVIEIEFQVHENEIEFQENEIEFDIFRKMKLNFRKMKLNFRKMLKSNWFQAYQMKFCFCLSVVLIFLTEVKELKSYARISAFCRSIRIQITVL